MRNALTAAILLATASAQASSFGALSGWIQPYAVFEDYREYVGTAAIPSDGILVQGLSFVQSIVNAGERVALVAYFVPIMRDDMTPDYSVLGAFREVRFAGADSNGVSLEARDGLPGAGFEQCMVESMGELPHAVSPRRQAFQRCSLLHPIVWRPWQLLRFPLSGQYTIQCPGFPRAAPLPLAFSSSSSQLRITLAGE